MVSIFRNIFSQPTPANHSHGQQIPQESDDSPFSFIKKLNPIDWISSDNNEGQANSKFSFLESDTPVRQKNLMAGGGIGGAVLGFFMGGAPGAIVGAAVGAGLGFLVDKVFDKVIGVLKNHAPLKNRPLDEDQQIFNGGQPYERNSSTDSSNRSQSYEQHNHYKHSAPGGYGYHRKPYVNINSLEGGQFVDGQTYYEPTEKGNGDGKTAYFFIGFTGSNHDQRMRMKVEPYFQDDIAKLRANGYRVVVDTQGTREAFQRAVNDDNNAGIVWAGHGVKSGIQDAKTNGFFKPEDITPNPNSQMRFCLFETCLAGHREKEWEEALGTDVRAHDRVIYDTEIMEFADPDDHDDQELDDFIQNELIDQPWS